MKIAKLFSKAKRRPRIKKLFIMSTGNKYKKGNQNIKIDLESNNVKVRDPFNKAWLNFTLKIDQRIKKYNFDHYSVRIVFSEGKIRIYIIVPFKQNTFVDGEFVAGFDFNVDRVNMVIVDKLGIIRDIRNVHFHRVTSPGFPKNKAKDIRLKVLAKLLDYARDHNCGIVVFENLKFKNKTKTKNKAANRKIHKFACKQFLSYGINMALRRGLKVYLVKPNNTSKKAKEIHKKLGLDIHTTAAFLLALKFLRQYYSV